MPRFVQGILWFCATLTIDDRWVRTANWSTACSVDEIGCRSGFRVQKASEGQIERGGLQQGSTSNREGGQPPIVLSELSDGRERGGQCLLGRRHVVELVVFTFEE